MSLPGRFRDVAVPAAWLAAGTALVLVAWVWRGWTACASLHPPHTTAVAPVPASSSHAAVPPVRDWSAFHARAALQTGALARRFRLAGTFLGDDATKPDNRQAVLDDLKAARQHIVAEGQSIEDVMVVAVQMDRVRLRSGAEEVELTLSFAGAGKVAVGGTNEAALKAGGPGDGWLGRRQLGENRWVFSRQGLLDYYAELRNEPERLVAVFDSLRPMYDPQRQITGYQLDVAGEGKFFDAVGMKPGDVVRSVNSMRMTSRRRAEYFLREFVDDRANVFVMEVERNGKPEKLVYEVR